MTRCGFIRRWLLSLASTNASPYHPSPYITAMRLEEGQPSQDDLKWVSTQLTREWCKLEEQRRKWEKEKRDPSARTAIFDEDEPPSTGCFYRNLNTIMEHVDDLRILHAPVSGFQRSERIGFVLYSDREISETDCAMLWIHPDHRDLGYGSKFVRDVHFRVLCTGGRVRSIRVADGTEEYWKKFGYQVITWGGPFSSVHMVAILRPAEYVIEYGTVTVAQKTGRLFDASTDGPALLEQLQTNHECKRLDRCEGGIQFDHGGQVRYGEGVFTVKRFKLSDLLAILGDLDRAGLACHFKYRRSDYSHQPQ